MKPAYTGFLLGIGFSGPYTAGVCFEQVNLCRNVLQLGHNYVYYRSDYNEEVAALTSIDGADS